VSAVVGNPGQKMLSLRAQRSSPRGELEITPSYDLAGVLTSEKTTPLSYSRFVAHKARNLRVLRRRLLLSRTLRICRQPE